MFLTENVILELRQILKTLKGSKEWGGEPRGATSESIFSFPVKTGKLLYNKNNSQSQATALEIDTSFLMT